MRVPHLASAATLGLVLAALVGAAPARAQMTARFLDYGTERGSPGADSTTYFANWPLSEAECIANVGIPVRLEMVPVQMPNLVLDLWDVGGGSGTPSMCQDGPTRASTTAPVCTHLDMVGTASTTPTIVMVPPQTFFPDGCATFADRSFYVMALSSEGDTSQTLMNTHYALVRVVLDPVAPGAPEVDDAAGDTAVRISWSVPDGTEALRRARVHVEACDCGVARTDGGPTDAPAAMTTDAPVDLDADLDAGPVDATLDVDAGLDLDAGMDLDASGDDAGMAAAGGGGPMVFEVTGSSPTSYTFDAAGFGLDLNQTACVTVTLVDLAGNEGPASNVACVTRVEVDGFWDAFCEDHGFDPTVPAELAECRARYAGCSCRTVGRGSRAGWSLGLLATVCLALVLRRAR